MPRYDWSTRLTTGEVITCTAVAAATTATAGIYAAFPAAAPFAVTAAAAGGTAAYSARKGVTRATIGVRVASWLTAGGWSSYHLATHTPPGTAGWITAACGGILAFAMNYAANTTEPRRSEQGAILAFKRQAVKTLAEWDERIARVGHIKGAVCGDMQPWPKEAGYTLEVKLPGGTTWKELAAHQDGFAADLDLPEGCGVEIAQGPTRGVAIIRVSTRNMISETVYVEEDFSELTINEPFPFSFHRDGTDAVMSLLDDCALLIGETGSGKTNMLNSIVMQLARMPDCMIWAIDITGAGVALPWIAPWAIKEDGRTTQASAPIVDWVAHTVPEAIVMLRMAIQIIAVRKARYQKLMRQHNTDKIPVSHELPAIVIIADEVAELPQELKTMLDSVDNTGRATRVRTVKCGLRATQDTITAAAKKQSKVRIGMSVTDPEELSYLFAGYQMLDPADAPCKGSGFYTVGKASPRPMKARRITPDIITSGSIACSGRRPKLDKISGTVKLYGKYASRWARALPALFPDEHQEGNLADEVEQYLADLVAADEHADAQLSGTEGVDDPTVNDAMDAAMQAVTGTDEHGNGTPPSMEQLQSMFAAAHRQPAPGGPREPVLVGEPAMEMENVIAMHPRHADRGGTATIAAPRPKVTSDRDKAYAYLWEAGQNGAGAQEIADWLRDEHDVDKPRTTVQGWLTTWAKDGTAVKIGSGSHAKYVHTDHTG